MEFLDAFQYVLDSLSLLHAGERVQVPKDKIGDIETYVYGIASGLKEYIANSTLRIEIDRALQAIDAVKTINCANLQDDIRDILVESLTAIKIEIADMTYKYFTVNDFDEDCEEDVELLTEVIKIKRGVSN